VVSQNMPEQVSTCVWAEACHIEKRKSRFTHAIREPNRWECTCIRSGSSRLEGEGEKVLSLEKAGDILGIRGCLGLVFRLGGGGVICPLFVFGEAGAKRNHKFFCGKREKK